MRTARGMAIALVAVLVLSVAVPARAQHESAGGRIEVTGVIVAIDARDRSFVLREDRRREDRFWVVQVLPQTRIEFGRHEANDDDDDGEKLAMARHLRPLRVGHIVEVEGRVIDGRRIAAREITVIGRAFRVPPFPGPRPPFGLPPLQAPQVFFPQDGAEVETGEFIIVGRTAPRAQVHVDVLTSWAFFHFVVGSADVTADGNGIFVATVRPSFRVSGGVYRITVRATASGVTSPQTTVSVRLR